MRVKRGEPAAACSLPTPPLPLPRSHRGGASSQTRGSRGAGVVTRPPCDLPLTPRCTRGAALAPRGVRGRCGRRSCGTSCCRWRKVATALARPLSSTQGVGWRGVRRRGEARRSRPGELRFPISSQIGKIRPLARPLVALPDPPGGDVGHQQLPPRGGKDGRSRPAHAIRAKERNPLRACQVILSGKLRDPSTAA